MNDQPDELTTSEDLMARVAEGDNYAFEALVKRHQGPVLNLIYRFIGRRARAEDMAQEVFIRVWQAAGRYEPTAKFDTWIYRITANLCVNELKSAHLRKLIPFSSGGKHENPEDYYLEMHADEGQTPEDALIVAEKKRQVYCAIRALPAKQRLAVILKRYDDLSYEEIAQILGCSVSAVDSLLIRAKRNLRKNLTPYEK
jgi:RNA polymerase sigma-70 factor (ECF subfamily)